MHLPVLTPEQSAEWDRRAEASGISLATLMDAAGRAVAQVLATRYPDRVAGGVLVAVGPGNNGGDGWVVARALHRLDVPVFVAPASSDGSLLNSQMATVARAEGVRVVQPDGPWPTVALGVDALLGTGAKGVLRGPVLALVERLNDLAVPLVAVDGPTGVDLGTGTTHGAAVQAALSLTFGGFRRGHLLARDECGDVVVVDIGHPPPDPAWPSFMMEAELARLQDRFGARDHKGTRGHIVVVGGDAGMSGALRLSCRAAFAAGAGLVHAVAPPATIDLLAAAEPDVQTLRHEFATPLAPALVRLLEGSDAVVIGPGLGRGESRLDFVSDVMRHAPSVVLDADALNAFAGDPARLKTLSAGRMVVLTPHPGEFRRLFPAQADGAECDPWSAAAAASAAVGCTVLLKGVPTVVASSVGPPLTVAAGNPGLATGGSGDILSGLVGTLLVQLQHPGVAAAAGAEALGRAADLAARRVTARGMRPMDVVAALPDLWRVWEALRQVRPVARPPILLELEAPQRW
ncbi:MAG TPA: NAD(P)H-hydrate dehydratase [Gemmatimonadales bacterium]|nr:NAD(P)H-hydrate dehydratase [Gemmatimonadales bacterium]